MPPGKNHRFFRASYGCTREARKHGHCATGFRTHQTQYFGRVKEKELEDPV